MTMAGTQPTTYAKTRLFIVSSLALTMAGIGAALRANTAADLNACSSIRSTRRTRPR